ncbi:MAG: DUF1456 family protein [Desulfuromonadales bacterium]|nr:DUF1456 family protein [Desulfuromonadales bacterium]
MAITARNNILRSIRNALNLDDATMIHIFGLAGRTVAQSTLTALQTTEDEDGHIPCTDPVLGFFLDGLIINKRGAREGAPAGDSAPSTALTNNVILKKLRIALDLKEDDMLAILKLGGIELSKHELSALFRKQGHKHYKECSDRFLMGFLAGLGLRNGE